MSGTECLVLLLALTAVTATSICDECVCTPPKKPTSVLCKCADSEKKDLELLGNNMTNCDSVKNFSVVNCMTVKVAGDAFKGKFKSLETLTLKGMKTLVLEKEALAGLGSLQTLTISRTSIYQLPQSTIHSLDMLKAVSLDHVHIEKVTKNAIKLTTSQGVSFKIANSKIDEIENEGLVFGPGKDFSLIKTDLNKVSASGFNLMSLGTVDIMENSFQRCKSTALDIRSNNTNMVGNSFNVYPSGWDEKTAMNFTNNVIEDSEWDLTAFQPLMTLPASSGNSVTCYCSFRDRLKLISTNKDYEKWAEENHCAVPCRLPLSKLREKCLHLRDPIENICKGEDLADSSSNTNPDPKNSSSSVSGSPSSTEKPEITTSSTGLTESSSSEALVTNGTEKPVEKQNQVNLPVSGSSTSAEPSVIENTENPAVPDESSSSATSSASEEHAPPAKSTHKSSIESVPQNGGADLVPTAVIIVTLIFSKLATFLCY